MIIDPKCFPNSWGSSKAWALDSSSSTSASSLTDWWAAGCGRGEVKCRKWAMSRSWSGGQWQSLVRQTWMADWYNCNSQTTQSTLRSSSCFLKVCEARSTVEEDTQCRITGYTYSWTTCLSTTVTTSNSFAEEQILNWYSMLNIHPSITPLRGYGYWVSAAQMKHLHQINKLQYLIQVPAKLRAWVQIVRLIVGLGHAYLTFQTYRSIGQKFKWPQSARIGWSACSNNSSDPCPKVYRHMRFES